MSENLKPNIFRDVQSKIAEFIKKGTDMSVSKGIADQATADEGAMQTNAYLGVALDAAILFGVWLNKTQQGDTDKLTIDEIEKMFFEKASRLNL